MYDSSQTNGKRNIVAKAAESELGGSTETTEGEYGLSVADLLGVIRKRLWVILLVTVVLMGVAVGFSLAQKPMYEASIKILVGQQRGTDEYVSAYDLEQLTQTIAEGVNSRPVSEGVIRQLGLHTTPEDLLDNLRVEQIGETQFIQASYRDASPKMAQRVANSVGRVFSERISEVSPSANSITATVWEQAVVPDTPVSPNPLRNGLMALVLGLMLGVGLAFLLEHLDDSWRSSQEVEQISGVPTFGAIPAFKISQGKKGAYRDGQISSRRG